MKLKLIAIVALSLFVGTIRAQTLTGTYTHGDQKLVFNGDSVKYSLNTNACVYYTFAGKGTFRSRTTTC